MSEMLKMALKSEYANAGMLMGLDGLEGALMQLTPSMNIVSRQQVLQKVMPKQYPSIGSRAEMEKFFPELPDHIKEGLLKGTLRLADTIIYSSKWLGGSKTVKMF